MYMNRRRNNAKKEEQKQRLQEAYQTLDRLARHETRESGLKSLVFQAKTKLATDQINRLLMRASEFSRFDEMTQLYYLKTLTVVMEETKSIELYSNTFRSVTKAAFRCIKSPRLCDASADVLTTALCRSHKAKEFFRVADTVCHLVLRLHTKVAAEQVGIAATIGRILFYIPLYEYGELFDTLLGALLDFLKNTKECDLFAAAYLSLSNVPKQNPAVYLRTYIATVFNVVLGLEAYYRENKLQYAAACAAAFECVEIWISYVLDTADVAELSDGIQQIFNWAIEVIRTSKQPHLREAALYSARSMEPYLNAVPNEDRNTANGSSEEEVGAREVIHSPDEEIEQKNSFFPEASKVEDESLGNSHNDQEIDHAPMYDKKSQDSPSTTGPPSYSFQLTCSDLSLATLASSPSSTLRFAIQHANTFSRDFETGQKKKIIPWEVLLPLECLQWNDWKTIQRSLRDRYFNSLYHSLLFVLRCKHERDTNFEIGVEEETHTKNVAFKIVKWLEQWQFHYGNVFDNFENSTSNHMYDLLLLFSGMTSASDDDIEEINWSTVGKRAATILVNCRVANRWV